MDGTTASHSSCGCIWGDVAGHRSWHSFTGSYEESRPWHSGNWKYDNIWRTWRQAWKILLKGPKTNKKKRKTLESSEFGKSLYVHGESPGPCLFTLRWSYSPACSVAPRCPIRENLLEELVVMVTKLVQTLSLHEKSSHTKMYSEQ